MYFFFKYTLCIIVAISDWLNEIEPNFTGVEV